MAVDYKARTKKSICSYCGNEYMKAGNISTCSYECKNRKKIAKENSAWVKRKPIEDRKRNINTRLWANPFRRHASWLKEKYN